MTPKQQRLEDKIMVHRYLYYVLCDPIISDYEYDLLDREATTLLPESSPVHQVGSSLVDSYSERVRSLAEEIKNGGRWT